VSACLCLRLIFDVQLSWLFAVSTSKAMDALPVLSKHNLALFLYVPYTSQFFLPCASLLGNCYFAPGHQVLRCSAVPLFRFMQSLHGDPVFVPCQSGRAKGATPLVRSPF
jgi:hypothetical protein